MRDIPPLKNNFTGIRCQLLELSANFCTTAPYSTVLTIMKVVLPQKITRKASDAEENLRRACNLRRSNQTTRYNKIAGFLPRHWLYE